MSGANENLFENIIRWCNFRRFSSFVSRVKFTKLEVKQSLHWKVKFGIKLKIKSKFECELKQNYSQGRKIHKIEDNINNSKVNNFANRGDTISAFVLVIRVIIEEVLTMTSFSGYIGIDTSYTNIETT